MRVRRHNEMPTIFRRIGLRIAPVPRRNMPANEALLTDCSGDPRVEPRARAAVFEALGELEPIKGEEALDPSVIPAGGARWSPIQVVQTFPGAADRYWRHS